MAKVKIKMPEDFLKQLSQLGDRTDEITVRSLAAGSEVVFQKVKSNLQAVVGKDAKYPSRSTGELVNALGISPPKLDKNGITNVKIGFAEPRKDGGSNAKIANILEFGKHNQPPKPFLKPAVSASRSACIAAMRKSFEDEVNKI